MFCKYSFSFLFLVGLVAPLCAKSLWLAPTNDERGMHARHVASRLGDILTVVITENTQLSTNGVNVSQTAQTSNARTEIFRLLAETGWGGLRVGNDSNGAPVSIDLSQIFSGAYGSGAGSITSEASVAEVSVSVHVIDVLPNGNLIIEGGKALKIAEETHYAVLRGIVRPLDVSDTNTIPSSRVASASIEFINEGTLSDAQKKGWLTKVLDTVSPF